MLPPPGPAPVVGCERAATAEELRLGAAVLRLARARDVPSDRDRPRRAAHVATANGPAWRCLRCGTFVVGEPRGSGPADQAPVVLRGKALRDAAILRVLAVERGSVASCWCCSPTASTPSTAPATRCARSSTTTSRCCARLTDRLGIDLESAGPVRLIEKALNAQHSTLLMVAAGVLAYGVLELVEAVGLWLMRRWGEYVAVVGTGGVHPARGLRARGAGDLAAARRVRAERLRGGLPALDQAAVRDPRRQGGLRGRAGGRLAARGRARRGRRGARAASPGSGDVRPAGRAPRS